MKKYVFLGLALIGIILPYMGFIPFVMENGFNIPLLVHQMFATNVSQFFSWDVVISGIVLLFFIVFDEKRPQTKPYFWIAIVGLLTVGVSFALPFYLFLREK